MLNVLIYHNVTEWEWSATLTNAWCNFPREMIRSRPQSCDPFGQRHGSTALAGSEAGSSRITDFRLSAQPQKLETITVTIAYKNGQLLRLRVILAPARALDPWRWPKGWQLWGQEWKQLSAKDWGKMTHTHKVTKE